MGGDLVQLDSPSVFSWSRVKTLRLKYLRNMTELPCDVRYLFPKLTYMEIQECYVGIDSIKCDEEGIWDPRMSQDVRHYAM